MRQGSNVIIIFRFNTKTQCKNFSALYGRHAGAPPRGIKHVRELRLAFLSLLIGHA